ncbi:unnamed protein product [Lymnaea stagnalis]|uniref:Paraoxonase n=1 Tax=Lymnaea stagnalis TaxID=6523 RepID=A0AAV2HA55_LYMST
MLLKAVLAAIVATLLYIAGNITLKFGYHLHYFKHHPGKCSPVTGADFGSEDLEVSSDGLAFISSGVTFSGVSQEFSEFISANKVKGRMLLFDFKKPELQVTELKIRPTKQFNPATFRPHGVSLINDRAKGQHLIYVINHPDGGEPDRVEKFRFLPQTRELDHVRSFSGDKLRLTNDLAVLAEDKFYISNFIYFKDSILNVFEKFMILNFGSVVFYNGSGFEETLTHLAGPNGITLSSDSRYLYVSFPSLGQLQVYERTPDNQLHLVQTVPLFTSPDNQHLSTSGDGLYTGAHPILYKAYQSLNNPLLHAPSSVLHIPLKDGKVLDDDVTELFYDHGDLISASSMAAVYDNRLIIGSVMHKLVVCQL